jgi:hypothetical protein
MNQGEANAVGSDSIKCLPAEKAVMLHGMEAMHPFHANNVPMKWGRNEEARAEVLRSRAERAGDARLRMWGLGRIATLTLESS